MRINRGVCNIISHSYIVEKIAEKETFSQFFCNINLTIYENPAIV